MKKHAVLALFLASSLGLLTSCQSTNVKPSKHQEKTEYTLSGAESLLDNASLLTGSAKSAQRLAAADMFANLGQPQRALDICAQVDPTSLDDALYAKHIEIQSQSLLALDNIYGAKGRLEQTRFEQLLPRLSAKKALQLRELRAELYSKLGSPIEAINERIALNRVALDKTEKQLNRELIWMNLMELDIDTLVQARSNSLDPLEQGWYELAVLSKNNQSNINQQYNALNQWRQEWPSHPANKPLPADLALIDNIVNNQPKHIALLLPFNGQLAPVAEAIRDGFMAAYYTNAQNGGAAPSVSLYNVNPNNINEQYDNAVNAGAEVIVGPLSKEAIAALAQRSTLSVPTLVLNQIDSPDAPPKALYQLGLAIEDEAQDAAERAIADNKELAMIIAPQDNQGDRAIQVFSARYRELGGQVVESLRYSNERELSGLIQKAMHINASQQRANEVRRIVGKIEAEPRRRQDVDCIFLVAQPREARQIKPLLAFHYAGDIPIYSTSSIHEGTSKLEPDLDGIRFSNLPWFFQSSPEKTAVNKGNALNARTQRLYALGVDAFYLYPRLEQLNNLNNANFWGQTGILSLNKQQQFHRKQQWARFSRGKVVPDTIAVADTPAESAME